MFVQVIQGRAHDPSAVRGLMERWAEELGPDAPGYLGSTAGVSDDGELVVVARFESEDAARRNSDRPEQGAWWDEFAKSLDGPATFHDATDVELLFDGGSDRAGFVQVIQGRVTDRDRFVSAQRQMQEAGRSDLGREDLIGGLMALHDGDRFTQLAYFTSEEEARRGESAEPSPERQRFWDEWTSSVDDVRYIDLRRPWLHSP